LVSDRMPYIVLRGPWCNIIVLNVHAPNEEKCDDSKDSINEELQQVLDYFNTTFPPTPRSSKWSFQKDSPSRPFLSPIRATCPTHLILVDLINRIIFGKEYKAYSSLRTLLHSCYFVSLVLKTLSLCSALNISNQVSCPYKTTGKITVLNILEFTLSVSKMEDNHVFISGR